MNAMTSHRGRGPGDAQKMYLPIFLIVSSIILQSYAESISRMQILKPSKLNDITPSPMEEWTSTNGWRPMISSSIAPASPPETQNSERIPVGSAKNQQRAPPTNDSPPKGHILGSRPPNGFALLPMQNQHSVMADMAAFVEDADDTLRPRPRRQKKRPTFKTIDSGAPLGLIGVSSSDQLLTFRGASSDSPFIRHVVVTEPSFPRHRPHSGSLRGVAPSHVHFRADPSQEMLPPTNAPLSSRPPPGFDGQHVRGRPVAAQQHHAQFHGPSFYFQAPSVPSSNVHHQHHHQIHQQTPQPVRTFPAVARPAEPLPGSLLRPHKERLTDSSAFHTGGVAFQTRPAPLQWSDSLNDGRHHYTVTSTPVVEERPMPWDDTAGGHQEAQDGDKPNQSPHRGNERIKGQEPPKDPFSPPEKKLKPQRNPVQNQPLATKTAPEEAHLWGGVGGASVDLREPNKDAVEGDGQRTASGEGGPTRTRISKKPSRGNVDGKRLNQGTVNIGNGGNLRIQDNQEQESVQPESPPEERPRPAKFRQNSNYRKKPIGGGEAIANFKVEPTMSHIEPTVTQGKFIPTEEGPKAVRDDNGSQIIRRPGLRKRRPKPTGQRQTSHSLKPSETIEVQHHQQQQQEQYQPQNFHPEQNKFRQEQVVVNDQHYQQVNDQHHQQVNDQHHQQVYDQIAQPQQHEINEPQRQHGEDIPQQGSAERPEQPSQEGQRPRKRGRRPNRTRKPASDLRLKIEGENHLAPTAVRADEQQVKWSTEPRPRPIVRSRRPRPEVKPTVETEQQEATALGYDNQRESYPHRGIKKTKPTAAAQEERLIDGYKNAGAYYRGEEIKEESVIKAEAIQQQSAEYNNPQQEGSVVEEATEIPSSPAVVEPILEHHETRETTIKPESNQETASEENDDARIPSTVATKVAEPKEVEPSSPPEVSSTEESPTTTVKPTSSAFGIRSRIRAGSRPRFSAKDYRERLNRLSQLSGRGKNSTEDSGGDSEANTTKSSTTGVGVTGPGRERWYPGRRQQQSLQEQQQLQHQRLQASTTRKDDQETPDAKTKPETRDRYRVRLPALRQRPSSSGEGESMKINAAGSGEKRQEEATTVSSTINRYRSRYSGRIATTTGSAEAEIPTTESPTTRRRGILTTYGMRRPLPLRVRVGTTTEVPSETTSEEPMTTTSTAITTTTPMTTTEEPTTTTAIPTTTTAPLTTTEGVKVPRIVENEVAEEDSEGPEEMEEDGVDIRDGFLRQDELINVGGPVTLSVMDGIPEESEEDDDEISPEQRVSDLTVWATTGQTGAKGKVAGKGGSGIVTFSAVSSYPATPYSPRFVTMATEDPVLPLEAFFFGPSASGGRDTARAR